MFNSLILDNNKKGCWLNINWSITQKTKPFDENLALAMTNLANSRVGLNLTGEN